VSLSVGSLKNSTGRIQDEPAQQALSTLQDETLAVFDGIRRLSHELHPATLRLVGLAAALKAHCSEVAKRHGAQVSFKAEDLGDLHSDVAISLFRVAQESLRNGIVHGEARRLAVSLTRSAEQIELSVADDGRGFDLEAVRHNGAGLGLVSMEERAHAIGGHLQIVTGPQAGTTICVRCPAGAREDPHNVRFSVATDKTAQVR
jgi:signal transduction histidine kinase